MDLELDRNISIYSDAALTLETNIAQMAYKKTKKGRQVLTMFKNVLHSGFYRKTVCIYRIRNLY